MMASKRNDQLDNIRALAILIVVLGHSIILYSGGWGLYTTSFRVPVLDYLKRLIDIVQMPVFFSLSGFLFAKQSGRKPLGCLMCSKALRLLVPYVVIAAVWMVPIKLLVAYQPYAGRSYADVMLRDILLMGDNGHLWYLPCLFLCFPVYQLADMGMKKWKPAMLLLLAFAALASLLADRIIPAKVQPINRVFHYFVWFMMGAVLSVYSGWKHRWMDAGAVVCGAGLTVLAIFRNHPVIVMAAAACDLYLLYRFMPRQRIGLCRFIGDQSFGVYLIHSPLIYLTFAFGADMNPILVVGMNFVVFGLTALGISFLLSCSRLAFIIGGTAAKK